jgi:hypothetical protein
MKSNSKSKACDSTDTASWVQWKNWPTVLAGFLLFAGAGTMWLGKHSDFQLPQKPDAPASASSHGFVESYCLSGRWRADAHTLVCVVEYLFQPERPVTNGLAVPVATPPFPARTNAETAMMISGDLMVRAT